MVPHIDEATWRRLRLRGWRHGNAPRTVYAVAAVLVLLLHLLFALLVRHTMQLRDRAWSEPPARRDDAIEVELIAPTRQTPPPPTPPSRPTEAHSKSPVTLPRERARSVPAPTAMQVIAPAAATTVSPPKLFNADGSVRTAAPAPAQTAPVPDYVQRPLTGDTQIMHDQNPVAYQSTRFDADYGKQGAIGRALNKAVQKTTLSHTFHPLPGVRIHCAISLAALAGGCGGDPPAPPSAKDGDQRLNMAPANPVVRGVQPPKAPSVDECVAIYRAGQPLPQGCPVDTPSRTTAAEMRDCVAKYRSYKVLAPGCPNDATIKQAAQPDAAQGSGH